MADKAFEAVTRARNQASSGNPNGAVDTMEAYLATDPHNTGARLVLANIAAKDLGDVQYAKVQLDIILDLEPENIEAMKAKASILAQDKKSNAQTRELFERLVALSPSAAIYNEYARFLRNQMLDFQTAADLYEKAIASEPSNPDYHQNYAVLLLNDLRDYEKAKSELEILMRMKPADQNIKRNYDKLMSTKFDDQGNLKKKSFLGRYRR